MMQGNSGAGAGDHREWERDRLAESQRSDPTAVGIPTGERGRRRFRNLRLHRQFAPMLVSITLLCTLGLTGLAYAGARSNAISSAEAHAVQDTQVERQLVIPQGTSLHLQDGRLVVTGAGAPLVLNNDTNVVDQTRSLTGDAASIYQAEGSRLVAVSTDIPAASTRGTPLPGSRALGDVLAGPAFDSVQGGCDATSPPSCHQTYQGIIAIRGISYVAAIVPLYDASGVYVGALSSAEPLDTVTAPTVQLAVMLLIAGLLLALLSLVAGFWFFGTLVERTIGALDIRLRLVGDAATELERLAQFQSAHAGRQDRVAQQVSEQVRTLATMAEVMEKGRASLRDASGDIWAEMSQPGLLPDSATAMRLAQQAAVATAQVGSAAEDARDVCSQLVGLMNHIVAEGDIVGNSGLEMEAQAKELRAAIESVEMTIGERLVRRALFLQRVRAASQRVCRILPASFSRTLQPGAGTDGGDERGGSPPRPVPKQRPMGRLNRTAPEPEWSGEQKPVPRPAAPGRIQKPRSVPLPPRYQQPQPRQRQAPRTPPRIIRTGELPHVHPNDQPRSGLRGGRDAAEPSSPRNGRTPPDSSRDDWNPGDARHSR